MCGVTAVWLANLRKPSFVFCSLPSLSLKAKSKVKHREAGQISTLASDRAGANQHENITNIN